MRTCEDYYTFGSIKLRTNYKMVQKSVLITRDHAVFSINDEVVYEIYSRIPLSEPRDDKDAIQQIKMLERYIKRIQELVRDFGACRLYGAEFFVNAVKVWNL